MRLGKKYQQEDFEEILKSDKFEFKVSLESSVRHQMAPEYQGSSEQTFSLRLFMQELMKRNYLLNYLLKNCAHLQNRQIRKSWPVVKRARMRRSPQQVIYSIIV